MKRLDGKDRVQTGVRLEKRLVKVLKALAELYDLSLGELLEDLVRDAFAGRQPLSDVALGQAAELIRIHGLSPAATGAPAQEGE
jgi:predicted DNA-binding ribbon-helix-helix protein